MLSVRWESKRAFLSHALHIVSSDLFQCVSKEVGFDGRAGKQSRVPLSNSLSLISLLRKPTGAGGRSHNVNQRAEWTVMRLATTVHRNNHFAGLQWLVLDILLERVLPLSSASPHVACRKWKPVCETEADFISADHEWGHIMGSQYAVYLLFGIYTHRPLY